MADVVTIEIMPTYTGAAVEATKKFFGEAFGSAMSAVKSSGLGKVGSEIGAVGGLAAGGASAGVGAVTGAVGGLGMIADLIGKFTNALNPALMQQFSMAMSDIFAVVGAALMPAFEILTPAIQMLGDFIASVLPSGDQMRELFQAMAPALDTVRNVLASIAPILSGVLATGLELLVPIIGTLVDVFKGAVDAIANVMLVLLKLIPAGIDAIDALQANVEKFLAGEKSDFGKSARGAAGMGASYVGVGELGRSAITAGFGGGMGPQEETAQNTKLIAGAVDTIQKTVAAIRAGAGPNAEQARGANVQ